MYSINVTVHYVKKDIAITEKALVAFEKESGKVYTIGEEAEQYIGAEGMVVSSPIKFGKVTDYTLADAFMRQLMDKVYEAAGGVMPFVRLSVGLCTKYSLNEVDKRSYCDLMYKAVKAKTVTMYEKSYEDLMALDKSDFKAPDIIIEIGSADVDELVKAAVEDVVAISEKQGISREEVIEKFRSFNG